MEVMIYGILFIITLMFVLIGWLIRFKKAYWLISGYNTMSEEKKKRVDIQALGKFIGNFCFAMAGIFLAALIALMLGSVFVLVMILAMILPLIIYVLIRAQKYDGNTRTLEGKMNKQTKVIIGSICGVLVLVAIGVGLLLYSTSKPVAYSVDDGILTISGMYGKEITIKDIKNLKLEDTLPEITYKRNGAALGSKCKGYFDLEGVGEALLFVDTQKPPFIYLELPEIVYLNCDDSEKTRAIFEDIIDQTKEK